MHCQGGLENVAIMDKGLGTGPERRSLYSRTQLQFTPEYCSAYSVHFHQTTRRSSSKTTTLRAPMFAGSYARMDGRGDPTLDPSPRS